MPDENWEDHRLLFDYEGTITDSSSPLPAPPRGSSNDNWRVVINTVICDHD